MDITTPSINIQQQPVTLNKRPQAAQVAQEFEAFFIFQMLEHMNKDVKSPEIFGNSMGEGMFRSMLNEKMADEIGKNGGLGIAQAVQAQIKRYQEVNK